ncbi:MAG: Na+-transporting NADH:ubiquinone oxidoreductase subunit C, partial [Oleispira sp.]
MERNSNAYTFLFVIVLIAVVASALAITATSLQPAQAENVKNEKMQNILGTVGIEVARDSASLPFEKYIVQRIALDNKGNERTDVNAFDIELKKELKKP